MKKIVKSFFLALSCMSTVYVCSAEADKWQLVKDEEGIKVYKYESADSEIIKAKSIIQINSTITAVEKVLNNIEYRHKWIPYLEKSRLIEKKSETESIEYSLFSAPWPATDRDFVYSLEQITNLSQNKVYRMKSVNSKLMHETKTSIRAELYESVYTITAIEDDVTQVELTFHANLKGWLPNWISNIIQKSVPYKTLYNLRSEMN